MGLSGLYSVTRHATLKSSKSYLGLILVRFRQYFQAGGVKRIPEFIVVWNSLLNTKHVHKCAQYLL